MNHRNAAHRAVAAEVKAKRIPPARLLACVDCSRQARDYDHRDYAQPLAVQPVCRSCNLRRGPALNSDCGDHQRTAFGRWMVSQDRGCAARAADHLGVPPALITQWCKGIRPAPADRAVAIELLTEAAVTCEEMRPDVLWVRMRDRKWPHPKGRPLVDLRIPEPAAKPAPEATA
jgi:DNA-binding transcriptional regulator YdaS (Cro superfamily)